MQTENNQKQNIQEIEQNLYYGSLLQQINLERTQGVYYEYNQQDFSFGEGEESLNNAMEYRHVQTKIDDSTYKLHKLLIPCVAAKALKFTKQKQDFKQSNNEKIYDSENFIQNIMIKTNNQTGVYGYQSGRRSLIFKDPKSGKYYRLKGCGNREDVKKEVGFSLLQCESLVEGTQEIRGAHFEHTCKRELYMSEQIQKIMEKNGVTVVNRPMGFWIYDQNFNEQLNDQNLQNSYPEVDKYCGIFENYGEKRVITHLIQGLNIILIGLCFKYEKNIDSQQLLSLFQKDRVENNCNYPQKTPIEFEGKTPEEIKNLGGIKNMLKQQLFWKLEDKQKYVDFLQFFEQKSQNQKEEPLKSEDWNYIFEICKIDQSYKELFDIIIQRIINLDFNNAMSLISFIYARIGYEMGNVMRIMLENEINWGYFKDHHPYIYHCNAHPNNLAILDPKLGSQNLTGTLDYDLAFFKKEFININQEEETYQKPDDALFDSFQNQSRLNLELALSGMEIYENFEFSTFDIKIFSQEIQDLFETFHVGNRDTLISYYISGFLDQKNCFEKSNIHQDNKQINENVNNIIKIALILTSGQTC